MRSGMRFHAECWGYQNNRDMVPTPEELKRQATHRTTVGEELGQTDAGPTAD